MVVEWWHSHEVPFEASIDTAFFIVSVIVVWLDAISAFGMMIHLYSLMKSQLDG